MPTVLSTKKLLPNQKELLLNAGIGLVEYDSIKISFIDFEVENRTIENAIFSSKNAVKAIIQKNIKIRNCFCVGDKTSSLLEKEGYKIVEMAWSSEALANQIITEHSDKEFQFFCGNKRREELPDLLKKSNIRLNETIVYHTDLNPRKFESEFDGILFFSPSGIQSFVQENKVNTIAFCIGETTAQEAKKHTKNIKIANKPAVENVIAKVVSNLKNE